MGCTLCKSCKQSCQTMGRTIKRGYTDLKRLRKANTEVNEVKEVKEVAEEPEPDIEETIKNISDENLHVEPVTEIIVHLEDSDVSGANSEFEFEMVN